MTNATVRFVPALLAWDPTLCAHVHRVPVRAILAAGADGA
jgi:hypothetical protein